MPEEIVLFQLEASENLFSGGRMIRIFRTGNRKIAIAKVFDKFHAFGSKCPHMDYPLEEGRLNAQTSEIACPWHNYIFSLNSGKEKLDRCKPLLKYPVHVNDSNEVCISLD